VPQIPATIPAFVLAIAVALLGLAGVAQARPAPSGSALKLPPWNPREVGAYQFTVRGVDDVVDLHGDPEGAQLVLFVAGNQFMLMPKLVQAFQKAHPEVERIFYETLPPGILAHQMEKGSIAIGNLVIQAKPDIYEAGKGRITQEVVAARVDTPISYATNTLTIMVRAGNPKHIASLGDLGRSDVSISMPNPQWEGIARQIEASYRKTGGDALDRTIMERKLSVGTTHLTRIHHRETPLALIDGTADAGVTWISEALFQERIGNPITHVVIPPKQNTVAIYEAAVVKDAPHAAAARAWMTFLTSPAARTIYRDYGFGAPPKTGSS
jgi:molybdate transport system substrate-binding protein